MQIEQARALLATRGTPTRRWEEFKYTPMPVLDIPGRAEIHPTSFAQLDEPARLRIEGGLLRAIGPLPAGVSLEAEDPDGPLPDGALAALNLLGLSDAPRLRIAGETPTPLVIERRPQEGEHYGRLAIDLGENSSLDLVELIGGEAVGTTNSMIRIDLARGARLRHLRIQEAPGTELSTTVVALGERASCSATLIAAGGGLSRQEYSAHLNGSHAEITLEGIYGAARGQIHDLTSAIYHNAPDCSSRETVHGVARAGGTGVFQAMIKVDQCAQRTDGYQLSRGLLLDDGAQIFSKPELEIYADDVKCSHGATSGPIDPSLLYYLATRGIDPDAARRLLVAAFLREITDRAPIAKARAAQALERLLDNLLAA